MNNNFLDSREVLRAKYEAEVGHTINIGFLSNFDYWVDNLVKNIRK